MLQWILMPVCWVQLGSKRVVCGQFSDTRCTQRCVCVIAPAILVDSRTAQDCHAAACLAVLPALRSQQQHSNALTTAIPISCCFKGLAAAHPREGLHSTNTFQGKLANTSHPHQCPRCIQVCSVHETVLCSSACMAIEHRANDDQVDHACDLPTCLGKHCCQNTVKVKNLLQNCLKMPWG